PGQRRLNEMPMPDGVPGSATKPTPGPVSSTLKPAARREAASEMVVRHGEAFSGLVTRNYGRADLTLLDFVKTANPDIVSIDVLRVGQRLKMPAFEPGALVQSNDPSQYRLHVMTVWDKDGPNVQKLRPHVAKQGRQLYVVPVSLSQKDQAYRVLIGDFADRPEAETFYRDFRIPTGVSSQLWR